MRQRFRNVRPRGLGTTGLKSTGPGALPTESWSPRRAGRPPTMEPGGSESLGGVAGPRRGFDGARREFIACPPRRLNFKRFIQVVTLLLCSSWSFAVESVPGAPLNQHDIIPILLRHCSACHGAPQQEAGLDVRSKRSMLRGGRSGSAFVPGKAEASLMVRRIRSGECPPSKRLVEANVKPVPAGALAKLMEWIDAGAIEVPAEPDLAGTERDPLVRGRDREFWAFQPPKRVSPPVLRAPELIRNPIDAFVLSRLEVKGLAFAAEASKLVLLRRVTFDLTSRVLVNRIWRHHFGQGLVRSVGNFGRSGSAPSHPELLDWLSGEFVRGGWSIKSLHRVMLTSRTYRQSSAASEKQLQADPDGGLLSRMPLRRLEAEALWDSLLLIAARLEETRFGPPVATRARADGVVLPGPTGRGWRRSIYGQQLRKDLPTVLELFDLPAMNPNCLERSESIVAPQALQLLNDPVMAELAGGFAQRVRSEVGSDPRQQVERAFWIALGRAPSHAEWIAGATVLTQLTAAWEDSRATRSAGLSPVVETRALTTLCHSLMNSAEFLYVD